MNKIFIRLQQAAGLSNFKCGEFLGISEGAVRDRRRGAFKPRKSELVALALANSSAAERAHEIIQTQCEHDFFNGDVCRICRYSKQ